MYNLKDKTNKEQLQAKIENTVNKIVFNNYSKTQSFTCTTFGRNSVYILKGERYKKSTLSHFNCSRTLLLNLIEDNFCCISEKIQASCHLILQIKEMSKKAKTGYPHITTTQNITRFATRA